MTNPSVNFLNRHQKEKYPGDGVGGDDDGAEDVEEVGQEDVEDKGEAVVDGVQVAGEPKL